MPVNVKPVRCMLERPNQFQLPIRSRISSYLLVPCLSSFLKNMNEYILFLFSCMAHFMKQTLTTLKNKMKLLLGSILIFNHAQTYAYAIPLSKPSKRIKPKRTNISIIGNNYLSEDDKKQATAIWVEKHRKTSLIKFKTPSLPLFKGYVKM